MPGRRVRCVCVCYQCVCVCVFRALPQVRARMGRGGGGDIAVRASSPQIVSCLLIQLPPRGRSMVYGHVIGVAKVSPSSLHVGIRQWCPSLWAAQVRPLTWPSRVDPSVRLAHRSLQERDIPLPDSTRPPTPFCTVLHVLDTHNVAITHCLRLSCSGCSSPNRRLGLSVGLSVTPSPSAS